MDINVTIYETNLIPSGFIVCNILAPTFDQFMMTPKKTIGNYDVNNAGTVLASSNIPAPGNVLGTLISFTGLPSVPWCFVEIMSSPDGTRANGNLMNACGYAVGVAGGPTEINGGGGINMACAFVHFTVSF